MTDSQAPCMATGCVDCADCARSGRGCWYLRPENESASEPAGSRPVPAAGEREEMPAGVTDFQLADALRPLLMRWLSEDDEDVDEYVITTAAINHLRQRPRAEIDRLLRLAPAVPVGVQPARTWIEARSNAMTDNPQTGRSAVPVVHPEPADRPASLNYQWLYTLAGKLEYAEEQEGHPKWLDQRNWPALLVTLADDLCARPPAIAAAVAAVRADLVAKVSRAVEELQEGPDAPMTPEFRAGYETGLHDAAAAVRSATKERLG